MPQSQALSKSTFILRNNLDITLISAVDQCLKSLRKTSRQLPPSVASHSSETRILERVLYKSKNQHGRTLFYRNLVEIKRLAVRIEQANLVKLVESIRASFYSKELSKSAAWKTAPWSQIPEARFLERLLQRLQIIIQLLVKAIDAYKKASIAFSRFSHSTAFLPLSVTVLGIAARLCILAVELSHVAQSIWRDIHQLLAETEPSHKLCSCKVIHVPEFLEPELVDEPLPASTSRLDPELGETVTRAMVSVEPSTQHIGVHSQDVEMQSTLRLDADVLDVEDAISFEVAAPIIRSVKHDEPASPMPESSSRLVELAANPPAKKRKKKPQPLDEIDSIFG